MKRGYQRILVAAAATLVLARHGLAAADDLDPGTKSQLAESHVTARLSPTHARRLYVLDTAFPAAEAAKTYVIDGSTGAIEGMFNQAYWPNFAVSPDGRELYAVDTYWDKHTRGKRSDYIVVRDAQTLEVKEDVPLPQGRLLIVSKKYNFDVTPDGRYGLTAVHGDHRDRPAGAAHGRLHPGAGLRARIRAGGRPVLVAVRGRLGRDGQLR